MQKSRFHLRYCVNSASLNFRPSQDSVDSTAVVSNGSGGGGGGPAPLTHMATIDGCGGGICTLKSREAMMRRKMEEEKKKGKAEEKAEEQSVG